jgi:hypothetical protein
LSPFSFAQKSSQQGLRFDASVPVELIERPAPELSGPDAGEYERIDTKIPRCLVQRPGSYVVLEYRQAVLKHRPSQRLKTISAPAAIFGGALADVSLLAGLLIDKFAYYLPLYRQHQACATVASRPSCRGRRDERFSIFLAHSPGKV